jgi:polyisoprenyl-teichoic acid--peptidoglycan teichoic acid transferase
MTTPAVPSATASGRPARRLPRLLALVAASLVLATVLGATVWVRSGATYLRVVDTQSAGSRWTPDQPLWILLLGDDKRNNGGCGCTDAVHLVGVPTGGGSAVMINIPRDTRMDIPGVGARRVNEAYQRGGPSLAAETVGRFAGVPIAYVFVTTFGGVRGMVDELGGLPIDLPMAFRDSNVGLDLPPGPIVLNGDAALSISRSRKPFASGDFQRTANQAMLLMAALAKLRAEGTSPQDTLRYLAVLMRHVKVQGADTAQLVRLGRLALSIDPANVRSVVLPGRPVMIGGASMVEATAAAYPLLADAADDAILQNH